MEGLKGKTKNAGYEFGIRRTFPFTPEEAWKFMFSQKTLNVWLGDLISGEIKLNSSYKTADGIEGTVTIYNPPPHIRMTFKKKEWKNGSILQIRFIPGRDKSTISFHQEKLLNYNQREEVKKRWQEVMHKIEKLLAN